MPVKGSSNQLNLDVADDVSKDNFRRVNNFFRDTAILKGVFEFYEFTVPNTTASLLTIPLYSISHTLGYRPTDVITTSLVGGTWVWNYTAFTDTTVTAAITVPANSQTVIRCFLGRYDERDING